MSGKLSVPEAQHYYILCNINTEDEMHIETTNWTPAKRKKLQHMTEFHEE